MVFNLYIKPIALKHQKEVQELVGLLAIAMNNEIGYHLVDSYQNLID